MMKHYASLILLLLAACTAAACSFGGPAEPPGGVTVATDVPTALVLDASGSMTENDAPGPRIAAAKTAAHALITDLRPGTEFALLAYGTHSGSSPADKQLGCKDVSTLIPRAPLDPVASGAAVDAIVPSGYTPIGEALRHAADQLPDSGKQAIILVSDGEDTCDVPPCEVAADLHERRPALAISTIGFRTDGDGDDELACIAAATDGLFVTADNADQLTTRLQATQDLGSARHALTASGRGGAQIGHSAARIRSAAPDLPPVPDSGTVKVVWRDCDLTFTDGVLVAIAPHDGGRTIDGIRPGSTVGDATALYGPPVHVDENGDGTRTLVFVADRDAGTGFQITATGNGDDARINTVLLCRCLPETGPMSSTPPPAVAAPTAVPKSDPAALTFGGTAAIQSGMSESALARVGITPHLATEHGCNTYKVPGADHLSVVATKGTVRGVRAVYDPSTSGVDPHTHTTSAIRIGSSAAHVRQTYSGYGITESYSGLDGTNLLLVEGPDGKYIGFSFPGNPDASDAIPDSATVTDIRAGDRDTASGFEVCSG